MLTQEMLDDAEEFVQKLLAEQERIQNSVKIEDKTDYSVPEEKG